MWVGFSVRDKGRGGQESELPIRSIGRNSLGGVGITNVTLVKFSWWGRGGCGGRRGGNSRRYLRWWGGP